MDANEKKLKELMLKIAKKEIRITSYGEVDEEANICASKIGGRPAVPKDFEWPVYKGMGYDDVEKERPLAFLAQINLAEASKYDEEGVLPKTGILSFFYELMSMTWGFDPKDKGSARVYYFPNIEELELMDLPKDMEEECIIPAMPANMESHISIPTLEEFEECIDEMDIDIDIDDDDYLEYREELGYEDDGWGNYTKLLGYPDTIQSSMQEECEIVARNCYLGNPEEYEELPDEVKEDIQEKSKDWKMLFQMGTISMDDGREVMFGDCGHIYLWIRKQDLEELNFDKVWLILQCG